MALLLVYIASLFPFSIFHHHENPVAYATATHCQKYVYYGKVADKCSHQTHLSKKTSICSLCDEHTVIPQIITQCEFNFIHKRETCKYALWRQRPIDIQHGEHADRGPPTI